MEIDGTREGGGLDPQGQPPRGSLAVRVWAAAVWWLVGFPLMVVMALVVIPAVCAAVAAALLVGIWGFCFFLVVVLVLARLGRREMLDKIKRKVEGLR